MKVFNISFRKLVRILFPVRLRKESLFAFLYAAIAPLETLYRLFTTIRASNLYRLLITPQVCYLQKFLNDKYDLVSRRIFIMDGEFRGLLFMYLRPEGNPVVFYTRVEGNPVFMYQRGEIFTQDVDFVVHVPASLSYNESQMRGEIDSYKLAGKKYKIVKS